MVTPAFLTIATVVLPLLMPSATRDCQFGPMGDPSADAQALTKFETAVNGYTDLRRRLERAWPPYWFVSDSEQSELIAEEIRRELRDVRPLARQGDFFTPEVALVFRSRIGNAVRASNLDVVALSMPAEDGETHSWWTPIVNERWALGGAGAAWPIVVDLPPLPFELEYRVVGRELVLLDVHASMVLDVLDLALPAFTPSIDRSPVGMLEEDADEKFILCWPEAIDEVPPAEEPAEH